MSQLRLSGQWQHGGPEIPIEFSRVSSTRSGALTLVIDPANGVPCPVSYVESSLGELEDTISDLRRREGTVLRRIGFVDLRTGRRRSGILPELADELGAWAEAEGFSSVVWTDLPSNFGEKTDKSYSVATAIDYLRNRLATEGERKAKEYVTKAPPSVVTPLRRALEKADWWGAYGEP